MLSPEIRKQQVLLYEGQAISAAGHHGKDGAIELARCAVDGVMNALIRMEGREAAATYAFALADRVVGGLREPTAFPVAPAPALPASASPPKPEPRRMNFWTIFIMGWACGFITGGMR